MTASGILRGQAGTPWPPPGKPTAPMHPTDTSLNEMAKQRGQNHHEWPMAKSKKMRHKPDTVLIHRDKRRGLYKILSAVLAF